MNTSHSARSPWPIALVAFFALAISGIIAFVIFAAGHGMDLVRPDYYEHELRYQSHLDALNRTVGLRHRVQLAYHADDSRLDIILPSHGAASQARGKLELYRPSDARLDRAVPIAPDAHGRESLKVDEIHPGLWKARVSWTAGDAEYFDEQTLVIPHHSTGR